VRHGRRLLESFDLMTGNLISATTGRIVSE
jgi:hypothetical protein